MARTARITGWKLPADERRKLLERFPPRYADVIADHVTLLLGANASAPLPRRPQTAVVLGRADDGESLECLVVEIDGTTDRPDGSTYHITWSLSRDRRTRESNDLLKSRGWKALHVPVRIELEPARF